MRHANERGLSPVVGVTRRHGRSGHLRPLPAERTIVSVNSRDPMAAWAEFGRKLELPLRGLREVAELRKALHRVERELVLAARENSSSWAEIGDALEISRQSAYRRHRPSVAQTDGDSPRPFR